MFHPLELLIFTTGYLLLLFSVAAYAQNRQRTRRSIVANPTVYALSLAVYCTSWTFYGSVGKAATSGLFFLTIYLGPTLVAALWVPLMGKVIRISRDQRITTLADFLGSRYGNSIALAALVTVVTVVGIIPYLGLQVKAIIDTFRILSGAELGSTAAGWLVTLIIGIFAAVFGAPRHSASEKHEGLVFAIAFESIVKLIAFMAAGVFVTYILFGGFGDIFSRIEQAGYADLMRLGGGGGGDYGEWAALLVLSMLAVIFLPRQFQMAVVENHDIDHVRKASWLFPLYLLLINIFVLPVAFGGILKGGTWAGADYFVLTLPIQEGWKALALLVFIGGFSAASGMLIVESLAVSNMVMNHILNPMLYRYSSVEGFPGLITNMRRLVILGLVFAGYVFGVGVGGPYSLVDMGLKSFEAVAIFAPAFFFGLYWKRGTRAGAAAGITAGFVLWAYTLLVPMLVNSGVFAEDGFVARLQNTVLLDPGALFGVRGFDQWGHTLFWGLLINSALYIGVSLLTRQDEQEERQALLFVERMAPSVVPARGISVEEIEALLRQFVGEEETERTIGGFVTSRAVEREALTQADLHQLREEALRVLSGALGAPVASLVLQERLAPSEQERKDLVDSITRMGRSLRLSRQELAVANRELEVLTEFSESIIESMPLGVATLDERMRVKYWNRGMEALTGIPKSKALGREATGVLGRLLPDLFAPQMHEGRVHEGRIHEGPLRSTSAGVELEGHVTRLSGHHPGYVIVIEDVTERKKIEDELFIATKHAGIGRLASGVSHEINNPLASISSLVQELLSEEPSKAKLNEALSTVLSHVHRIARIVRDLGDFARLHPREKVPTDLCEALEKTLSLVRYDKNFREVKISVDCEPLPPLRLDPDRIQQVFLNLALNARDAMPGGGRLKVTVRGHGVFAEVAFEDTGEGVPEEIRDKIFDPFFSTKRPSRGTGLGLSVSYSIIKDHGGTIEVQEAASKGARFVIRLPMGQR